MIKKLFAILTCIALLCVCFTACGDKKEDETPAGSDTVAGSGGGEETGGGEDISALTEAYGADRDPYVQDLDRWE